MDISDRDAEEGHNRGDTGTSGNGHNTLVGIDGVHETRSLDTTDVHLLGEFTLLVHLDQLLGPVTGSSSDDGEALLLFLSSVLTPDELLGGQRAAEGVELPQIVERNTSVGANTRVNSPESNEDDSR